MLRSVITSVTTEQEALNDEQDARCYCRHLSESCRDLLLDVVTVMKRQRNVITPLAAVYATSFETLR